WGGGYYPNDDFFDSCDELGLVVWQDFMFACAVYDLTEEFARSVIAEFGDNIRRLRHHPSLGLWSANNEVEEEYLSLGEKWGITPKLKADYIRLFEFIIPCELSRLDPDTFFWPSSPSSGGGFDVPYDPNRGDAHYWDVWHGSKPFSDYRNYFFRFASEFGFQSFPCDKTIESFTLPEDRNVFSYVMEKHQRNGAANGKILTYLSQTFLYPNSFSLLLYASQLMQAEAIRYGVEHWRRNRGRCMGAIYWQINDCWPVASWSSLDYFGRWKALHYAAKRFFAPVLLSCEEEGTLDQRTSVNMQPFEPLRVTARLNVSNETRRSVSGIVRWKLCDASSKVLENGDWPAEVPAMSAVWLDKLDFSTYDPRDVYLSFELESDGEIISRGSTLFCAPKHFRFHDPALTVRREGDELIVTAAAYARQVEIVCEDGDCWYDDNDFDLNAGERRIRIVRGSGDRFTVRSVFDIK
ncbi:MAG: glycoside hydrolase family 2 protein, partial [Eubacteriales bacterium]|nr:glycoside hydrolase family 2 protein [Eubacteriales bacterium]